MAKEVVHDGRFGWRGWLGVLTRLTVVGGMVACVAALGWIIGPVSSSHAKPPVSPLSNRDYGYWYCWHVGDPHPQHLGAMVHGDHRRSDAELQQATATP